MLHLWRTQLVELVGQTLWLLAGVGAGTLLVGGGLAWLVVHHRFPGRGVLEWALILPLAVPAYVIGFAFIGIFEYAGPLQGALRRWLGAGVRLPEIRSYGGVVAMMTLVFYPYVYLLARVAFREQGAASVETARMLGRSRGSAFLRITVPMARPALVAGVALAMSMARRLRAPSRASLSHATEGDLPVGYWMFDRLAATQLPSGSPLAAGCLLDRHSRGPLAYPERPPRAGGGAGAPQGWLPSARLSRPAVLTLAFRSGGQLACGRSSRSARQSHRTCRSPRAHLRARGRHRRGVLLARVLLAYGAGCT